MQFKIGQVVELVATGERGRVTGRIPGAALVVVDFAEFGNGPVTDAVVHTADLRPEQTILERAAIGTRIYRNQFKDARAAWLFAYHFIRFMRSDYQPVGDRCPAPRYARQNLVPEATL